MTGGPPVGSSRPAFGSGGAERGVAPVEQEPDLLPPDAVVDLAAVRAEAGIDEVLATLDRELVGLAPVKTRIAEIASLLLVDRTRARFGVHAPPPTLHMCFTGS